MVLVSKKSKYSNVQTYFILWSFGGKEMATQKITRREF